MPRIRPTEYVDRIGELDVEPVAWNSAAEYLTSKENNKIFLKPPPVNSTVEDLESFYVYEKIQHENVTKNLIEYREDRKLQKLILHYRISRASKDAAILREAFVDLNVTARDLNERKKLSLKIIGIEKEKQKELIEEIKEKREHYVGLKKFKKVFQASCNEYEIYERVLAEAAKISQVPSVNELTGRCDAIMLAQTEIIELNSKLMQSIMAMRKKMMAVIKHTELVYVGLKNELDQMNHFYRMAVQDCLRWERIFLKANEAVIEVNLDKGMYKEAINQLYMLLCRRKGVNPIYRRSEVEQCLKFILTETRLMRDIIEECNNPKLNINGKKDICSIAK